MKRQGEKHVNEAVDAFFESLGLNQKRKEMIVINSWESFVGTTIAKATDSIKIYKGVLFLKVNSSIVRNELLMLRQNIVDVINSKMNCEIIRDVVVK